MIRSRFLFTVLILILTISQAHAFTGPAPVGSALADYNPSTGEITVSVNGVNNWYIESSSSRLTGDEPSHSPILPIASLPTNTDSLIGETSFNLGSATDVSLGNVAATGISFGDLQIFWNPGLGSPLQSRPVFTSLNSTGSTNYQPIAHLADPVPVNLAADPLNITLDASSTIDDGNNAPLTYEWDLDNDGIFEVSTGISATLDIADVTATFGGVGDYLIVVRAFDGEFYSEELMLVGGENRRTLTLFSEPVPEPSTLFLASLAALGILSKRKRPAP